MVQLITGEAEIPQAIMGAVTPVDRILVPTIRVRHCSPQQSGGGLFHPNLGHGSTNSWTKPKAKPKWTDGMGYLWRSGVNVQTPPGHLAVRFETPSLHRSCRRRCSWEQASRTPRTGPRTFFSILDSLDLFTLRVKSQKHPSEVSGNLAQLALEPNTFAKSEDPLQRTVEPASALVHLRFG
jgi:hypothetical protein